MVFFISQIDAIVGIVHNALAMFVISPSSIVTKQALILSGRIYLIFVFVRLDIAINDIPRLMSNLQSHFLPIHQLFCQYSYHSQLSKKFYDIELMIQLVLGFSIHSLKAGPLLPRPQAPNFLT